MNKVIPKDSHLIPPEAKLVFRGEIFDVYQWPQKMFDGSTETFEMLRRVDTVNIVAVNDGKIVVLRQTQPTIEKVFLGFPGGRAERGEAPLDAAKRELSEETGMKFKNWRLVNVVQPVQKIEWFIYTYLATGFDGQGETRHDAGEKIEMLNLSFEEMVKDSAGERRIDGNFLASYDGLQNLIDAPEFMGMEVEAQAGNT